MEVGGENGARGRQKGGAGAGQGVGECPGEGVVEGGEAQAVWCAAGAT